MSAAVSLPRIHQLSAEVANQIAAGEVIERPASVVKELVENSIDAAATKVEIDVVKAGVVQIRVHDNGQGIHKDDLKLALMPHATSKLTDFSDLAQIASLGFRGEALPSIASVSRFKLTSRQQDMEQAWSIDNTLDIKPAAHAHGTTVEVNDLFHATPARRKFLKSDRTEFLHIQSLLKAMALGHASVAFKLRHDDETVMQYSSCPEMPEQRVRDVCGKAFINNSVAFQCERDGMLLQGWLGLNEQARSQSDRQYIFINGRLVQDKHLNHAIRLAYTDRIDAGRFPSYVLYLHIDPARIDINVHPAKSEVRFQETRNVHDFFYAALLSVFAEKTIGFPNGKETNNISTHNEVNDITESYLARNIDQPDLLNQGRTSLRHMVLANGKYVIADLLSEHILIEIEKTRRLLARHKFLQDFKNSTVKQRTIIVAVTCDLNNTQLACFDSYHEQIERWGFSLELVAPAKIVIRAIPELLPYADTIALVYDLLDCVNRNESSEQIATSLAAHVNDAGMMISDEEIDNMVQGISEFEQQQEKTQSRSWRRLNAEALSGFFSSGR